MYSIPTLETMSTNYTLDDEVATKVPAGGSSDEVCFLVRLAVTCQNQNLPRRKQQLPLVGCLLSRSRDDAEEEALAGNGLGDETLALAAATKAGRVEAFEGLGLAGSPLADCLMTVHHLAFGLEG